MTDIWTDELILDYNGKPLNSEIVYGERILGKMITRHINIVNGIPDLPDDMEITGETTQSGFIANGFRFKNKDKIKYYEVH